MAKQKKILMLNYEFPPLGGGAATANKQILDKLKNRKDLQIDLITSSVGKYREEKYAENIRIFYLDIEKKGDLHTQSLKDLLVYSKKAYPKMKELDSEMNYDIVHAFFGIPCGFLAMLLGKPYIVSLRGSDVPFYSRKYYLLDLFVFQFLSKLIWKKAAYVVANSSGLRDLAYKTILNTQIEIIPNGIDLNRFKPGKKNSKFTVISTARLIERKGINYLVEAFGRFAHDKEDVLLEISGEGPELDKLKELAQELGVEDKVIFLGNVSREDMPKKMAAAHVFVLPSLNEGMSNSLLEALASGIPAIVTDVGGTRELVNDDNGFIVEKKNASQIFYGLEKVYNDIELLEKMGKNARSVVGDMSWEKVSQSYYNLYKNANGRN